MATPRSARGILWLKAARRDFEQFPAGVRERFHDALAMVSHGGFPDMAKPMTGLGPGVVELALPHRGDAFRLVYVLLVGTELWIIHAFQKKSTRGIAIPKRDIQTIRQRLNYLRSTPR